MNGNTKEFICIDLTLTLNRLIKVIALDNDLVIPGELQSIIRLRKSRPIIYRPKYSIVDKKYTTVTVSYSIYQRHKHDK